MKNVKSPSRWFSRLGSWAGIASVLLCGTAALAQENLGLKVPPGFVVTRYSDPSLVHDIHSMTIDTAGRVVVAGPGYVKILIDTDGDGRADEAKTYANGPVSGAQGLCFLGRDLLCSGDAGLIRYRDDDGDDRADGPPETFLKVKTGGEHNAHAVRRGPDGWWYVLVGNTGEINPGYITLPRSPIKYPHAGAVLRLKPDLTGGEVFADGFRNAYDFDFNEQGDLFVYDSDGERDVTLPWYQPSRLFHVVSGGEHGWITDSWKRPDDFIDAPPVVVETGRSSPTGIVTYRHSQFPAAYQGGQFLLDWTFGRIFFTPMQRKGATWAGTPQTFLMAEGGVGFAPTDIEVGIDGSLYVCVGGRGTHGTVYRITYTGPDRPADTTPALLKLNDSSSNEEILLACLTVPQPASSWARARWIPAVKKLGSAVLVRAAQDINLSASARVRAIEILTEIFEGLTPGTAELLATSTLPEVRARVVWSLGVNHSGTLSAATLNPFLQDSDPLVRRAGLEAVFASGISATELVPSIARCLNDDDRLVRMAATRLIPDLDAAAFKSLADAARRLGWKAALTNTIGYIWRTAPTNGGFNTYGLDICRRILDGKHSRDLKYEALRVLQLSVGDMGPNEKQPAALDGYSSQISLAKHDAELKPIRQSLVALFPSGDVAFDRELSRTIAVLGVDSPEVLTKVLAMISDSTAPADDIHYLCVASRIHTARDDKARAAIAKALVSLDRKVKERNLTQDNNWGERVGEVYAELVTLDVKLPEAILDQPTFGRSGHVLFLSKITQEQLPKAVDLFFKAITSQPDYAWTNDVVFIMSNGKKPEHRELIRSQFERYDLRMAILMVLAPEPQESERELFASGLEYPPIEILTACIGALEKLPSTQDVEEVVALLKLLRRLGDDPREFPLRERVARLLERNLGEHSPFVYGELGHVPQPEAMKKWTEYITTKYPAAARLMSGGNAEDFEALKQRLPKIDWNKGDLKRGEKLFTSRGCAQCHGGSQGLGPALSGAAGRFSKEDLFTAIVLPNRDVSPRYQTILIETKQGKAYSGLIVYEAADGLLLRNGSQQTFRIETKDIEVRRPLTTSVMPNGLLKDLNDGDYADLYKYIQSLSLRTAQSESENSAK